MNFTGFEICPLNFILQFFFKKGNKLTLCAAYAACLPFAFLQQLLFSEPPLNENLTVELMLSLCLGKWPQQLLELGKKGKKPWKSPGPSNVFKCNKNKGTMQTLTQSLKEDTVKILFCFADLWTCLSGHSQSKDVELITTEKAYPSSQRGICCLQYVWSAIFRGQKLAPITRRLLFNCAVVYRW